MSESPREGVTPVRVVLWMVVAGAGVYLLLSGVVGIFAKAAGAE